MGRLDKWRNFLCALFSSCFHPTLEPGTAFDVILVDLMMFLASQVMDKKHPAFDGPRVIRRLEDAVRHYANREQDPARPQVTDSLVLMLDTPQHVPRNKAATQQSRDTKARATTASDEEADDEDEPVLATTGPHMDERLYNELVAGRDGDTESLFIDVGKPTPPSLTGATVWRSVNLKFQLYRLITLHLLQQQVPELQTLVIDDGIAVSTRRLAEVRAAILQDHPQWQQRSAFDRECLVHQLLVQEGFYQRLVLYDDRQFHRHTSSLVGEADIKIQAYIRPHNGARTYLCVNQDTDIIFVLLLHMRYFLKGLSEEEARDVEVWIDTRSPSDKANAPPRPYRYINVKALYYALLDLFAREYPSVQQPVETFCFLVFSLLTDYTKPFAGCLAVGARQVWNTFSELHSVVTRQEGYILFTDKPDAKTLKRQKLSQYSSQLHQILGQAVHYDRKSRHFVLQQEPIARFYYYLCQHRVMHTRTQLHMPTPEVKTALRTQELLLYARNLAERLDAYRTGGGSGDYEEEMQVEAVTPQQMFDSPTLPTKLSGVELQRFLRENAAILASLTRKPTPPLYGVPSRQQMAARIARIAWYLKYCRHGWQSLRHISDTVHWGWRETETPICNSTYNEARRTERGDYKYYATSEYDDGVTVSIQ